MEQAVKECSKCKRVFPLTEFKKDHRYALGVGSYCRSCRSEANRKTPSHTSKRGVEYRPLPPRDSLKAQMSVELWTWFEKKLPENMLTALAMIWDSERVQDYATEVARLELIIEQQAFESDPCIDCGQAQCVCDRAVPVDAPVFTDISSLPEIPGI